MYNLLISAGLALLLAVVTSAVFGSVWAGILPATLVFFLAWFLLARRTGQQVTAELEQLVPLLEARKVDEAVELIEQVQAKYGNWQPLLEGQLEAQKGMIDYLQLKFDSALPKLEKGKWRNWTALVCIGAIHYRKGRKELAWQAFDDAVKAGPKEAMAYVVYAVLLTRSDERDRALAVLSKGLESVESPVLQDVKKTIANKKKIDVSKLPQTWFQFFPEDMARQMVRGRRGAPQQQVVPFPGGRMSKRARRGR